MPKEYTPSLFTDESNDVNSYLPFIYVDVSDALLFALYIQPVPKRFNVTIYRVWLTNNSTGKTTDVNVTQPKNEEHIQYNFSILDGIYYFKVAAMHPNCSVYGCVNATSPFISISMRYYCSYPVLTNFFKRLL